MSNSSTSQINIGGDIYYLEKNAPMLFVYKDRYAFEKTFRPLSTNALPLSRIEQLLRTYFPLSRKSTDPFVFSSDSPKDKADVLTILKRRRDQIQGSLINTVSQLNLSVILENIDNIIKQLETGTTISSNKKSRKKLTETEMFELILEFSWYLMHPNMNMNDQWEDMIKKLDTKALDKIVSEIQEEEKKQGAESTKPLNYFKHIDLQDVMKQPTKEAALQRVKNMVVFPTTQTGKEMKTRLTNLLNILYMKKYIEKPSYQMNLPVIQNKNLQSTRNYLPIRLVQKGGGNEVKEEVEPNNKGSNQVKEEVEEKEEKEETIIPTSALYSAFLPLVEYLRTMYDPLYSFFEKVIKKEKSHQKDKLLHSLLTLLHLCNHIPSDKYGIYRIEHVPTSAFAFIGSLLDKISPEVTPPKNTPPTEDQIDFLANLMKLPKLALSTFKIGYKTTKSYKNPENVPSDMPYVHFMILDKNMKYLSESQFPQDSNERGTQMTEVAEFFQENTLYLSVSDSKPSENTVTPMRVYSIDFNQIENDSNALPIDELKDNYFNKYIADKKEPSLSLERMIDLAPEQTLNQGVIAMCIHILLQYQLSQ